MVKIECGEVKKKTAWTTMRSKGRGFESPTIPGGSFKGEAKGNTEISRG